MQRCFFVATFIAYILSLTALQQAWAAESQVITPQHVSASIITATNGLDNDSPTRIGIRLQAPEHWHTYWKNPADSGMPTKITLTLPHGYTHSDIYWPMPERIISSDIISFGYQGDTVFPLVITPPKPPTQHSGFSMASIKATVEWLACNEICVPESAELQLTLPEESSPATHAHHAQLIESAWAASPTTPAAPITLEHTDTSLILHIASTALPQDPIEKLDIFPLTENAVSYKPTHTWTRDDAGLHITLNTVDKAKPANFSAVLALTQQGKTTALTLDSQATTPISSTAPIATPAPASPSTNTHNNTSPAATPTTPSITQPTTTESEPTASAISFTSALLLALMGGLILNVMPCVLPVLSLKLLSLAKKAQASKAESLRHGIAYSLGVMSCFTILGVVLLAFQQAGELVGWGFQLQSPLVLACLMVLMMLVGLNLIGAFSVPDVLGSAGMSLTTKNNALGSFFTGALAAIAATPCTAPFMAPAVGFALTQSPAMSMLIFEMIGFGMASPYLLISAFPTCLRFIPKSGAWMETLRQFFAFPMFATAAWLLWVLTRQANADALAPTLALLIFITLGIWTHRRVTKKTIKNILYILCVLSIYYCISLISHSTNEMHSKSSKSATKEDALAFNPATLAQLRSEGVPVFVNATADWCLTCKVNELSTLSRAEINAHFSQHNIRYMVADWTNRDDAITQFLKEHQRQGVPTYVFYPPHAQPIILPQILSVDTVKKMTCASNCAAQ